MTVIKGKLIPIRDHVIVSDMYFGSQKSAGGIIIRDDDGTSRGIYPRWAKVHAKGLENIDEYQIGDWVLVEHGRWTRGFQVDEGTGSIELRRVEPSSILLWQNEKPDTGIMVGDAIEVGRSTTHRPEDFI